MAAPLSAPSALVATSASAPQDVLSPSTHHDMLKFLEDDEEVDQPVDGSVAQASHEGTKSAGLQLITHGLQVKAAELDMQAAHIKAKMLNDGYPEFKRRAPSPAADEELWDSFESDHDVSTVPHACRPEELNVEQKKEQIRRKLINIIDPSEWADVFAEATELNIPEFLAEIYNAHAKVIKQNEPAPK